MARKNANIFLQYFHSIIINAWSNGPPQLAYRKRERFALKTLGLAAVLQHLAVFVLYKDTLYWANSKTHTLEQF